MKGWAVGLNPEEITLINLYISLNVARAKRDLFEEKKCGVPETLTLRILDLEAAIHEHECKAVSLET